jgi:hypothetical protein
MQDPVGIAKQALELKQDPLKLLSLQASAPFTAESPVSDVRRAYMRLAQLIHPDKLSAVFSQATEAFQALVQAFDAFANRELTAPPKPTRTRQPKPKPAAPVGTAKLGKADAPKRARAVRAKDVSSSEPSSSDSDEEVAAAALPNYAPRKQRSNDGCFITPMGCPNCQTPWVPDTPKAYTLVMAYGVKVHCETCLLHYGWATALHCCPRCKKQVDYDPENYNKQVVCGHCRGAFGYRHFPVDDRVLGELAAKREREGAEAAARSEREDRMARRGRAHGASDDLDMKVGECLVEDRCPNCRKAVKSKHRDHVIACLASGQKPPPKARPVTIIGEGRAKPARRKATKAPAAKLATKKTPARRRRRSSSDDDTSSD